ncbi:protein lethal(2)essential for life-like [Stegodyphus dumicola]|uniref:protein lethal(2)essential for life-like n=1 Tax=Stegodyphus dumicola TaxID=202533 RepID=UPI0015AFA2BC|nr:protein lethal(2)essential for life-like [Stegodyphus dumicola]
MALSALVPALLGRDWWDTWDYPNRIMDQFFANPLLEEDLLPPSIFRGFLLRPRTQANIAASGQSEVKNDEKQFQVALNVSQFKPEEIEVKIVDNYVVIHGKHEEKSDEHGFVSREFTRRYMLPHNCESETVTSSLSPDGVLTINAPKKAIEPPPTQERKIPIAKEK